MISSSYQLSAAQVSDYAELGYAYLNDYVPVDCLEQVRETISRWTRAYAIEHGFGQFEATSSPHVFDSGLVAIREQSQEHAGRIYDAVKKMPPFAQWAFGSRHIVLAETLLGSKEVGIASRGWGMRIDYPFDNHHATQLHQDIVSQLCGPLGVVIWAPLRDVTASMGPVVLYPGSHREGTFPLSINGPASQDVVLADEEQLRRRFGSVCPEVKAGDAIVMDFRLLHESGANVSPHPRWSMLTRLFDAANPGSIRIAWRGGLQEGNQYQDFADYLA